MYVRERIRLLEEQRKNCIDVSKRNGGLPLAQTKFGTEKPKPPPVPAKFNKHSKPLVPPKPKALIHKPKVFEDIQEIELIDLEDREYEKFSGGTNTPRCWQELSESTDESTVEEDEIPPPLPTRPSRLVNKATNDGSNNNLLANTTVAFKSAFTNATSTVKSATANVSKPFQAIPENVKQTVPKIFLGNLENFSDASKLRQGKSGLCSWCARIPLDQCFANASDVKAPYVLWTSHLSRIAVHGSWCELCKILLEMLCREQHDPVLVPYVQEYLERDWLRGVPFKTWLSEEYIHDKKLWPFGHSENYEDGSNYETISQMAERAGDIALKTAYRALIRSRRSGRHSRRRAQPRREKQMFPVTALVLITISTATAEDPGLLWVDLMGCSNRPHSEEIVLSHFMLRAVHGGLSITSKPHKSLTYGHVLDPRWIELSMARMWLSECELRHGKTCSEHGWAAVMQAPTFIRLIDVNDLRIVKPHTSPRFVALSYVWGGANTLKLTTANMKEFSRPGGLRQHLSRIPRTILDAMEVVRVIGERYLWCDALCIVQEASAESQEQINNMDRIYGSALFTIVAASGESADAGLPGVQRADIDIESIPRTTNQPVATINDTTSIVAPFVHAECLSTSPKSWHSRAWTFQERLLSRRLLVFSEEGMIWHCRTSIAREDMSVHQSSYEHKPLKWLSLQPRHLGIDVNNSHWIDGHFEINRHGHTFLVRSATFAEYASMIAQYSSRTMTYESDVLNALAGLLRIFSLAFQSECIAGLPSILMDVALLWHPVKPLVKRTTSLGFPSWSWAGWEGEISYRQPIKMQRDDTGQTIETEGIRPLLRYFVFNGIKGSLEPLNGTSRGVPLTDDAIPVEWEASSRSVPSPELFDLDARTIPHISNQHLVFYSSVVDQFDLVDAHDTNMSPLEHSVVLDTLAMKMHIRFLEYSEHRSGLRLIKLGETVGKSGFDRYLVMLVDESPETGISRRCGLGSVPKSSWIVADPMVKLICLG